MNLHRLIRGLVIIGMGLIAWLPYSNGDVNAQATDLFVSTTGAGTECSQVNPCLPGQAISDAAAGDTLYFKFGSYMDGLSDPYLTIDKAVSLIGGWDGAPAGEVFVDPDMYEVVINGGGTRSLFRVNDTGGTGGLITITGFKFQNGYESPSGGAINIQNGRVDIVGNLFQENIAGSYGGAIYTGSSYDVHILNNSFVGNEVTYGGGSIFAATSSATTLIEGNTFIGGNADYGTAIHNDNCPLEITRNLFKDNPGSSTIDLYSNGYSSTVRNNIIVRPTQTAIALGGTNTSPHQISNNTIVGAQYGIQPVNSSANIVNNIISYTNSSILTSSGTLSGSNNLFYENGSDLNPLTAPVYEDPMFVDPSADDYHLDKESPAVDAGAVVTLDEDYDGDERPIGDGYDIGADEVKRQFFGFLPLFMK